jgi:hypothetical protein
MRRASWVLAQVMLVGSWRKAEGTTTWRSVSSFALIVGITDVLCRLRLRYPQQRLLSREGPAASSAASLTRSGGSSSGGVLGFPSASRLGRRIGPAQDSPHRQNYATLQRGASPGEAAEWQKLRSPELRGAVVKG